MVVSVFLLSFCKLFWVSYSVVMLGIIIINGMRNFNKVVKVRFFCVLVRFFVFSVCWMMYWLKF